MRGSVAESREWSREYPHAFAAAAGVVWSLLWFGVFEVGGSTHQFWIVSLVVVAPVLVILSEPGWRSAGVVGVAYVSSLVAAAALFFAAGGFTRDAEVWVLLIHRANVAWLPIWIVVTIWATVRVVRRRRHRQR